MEGYGPIKCRVWNSVPTGFISRKQMAADGLKGHFIVGRPSSEREWMEKWHEHTPWGLTPKEKKTAEEISLNIAKQIEFYGNVMQKSNLSQIVIKLNKNTFAEFYPEPPTKKTLEIIPTKLGKIKWVETTYSYSKIFQRLDVNSKEEWHSIT